MCLATQCYGSAWAALPWRRWTAVDNYHRAWLLAGENERGDPAEKRKSKEDVEDDNSSGVGAFSPDGHDGGKEIHDRSQKQDNDEKEYLDRGNIVQVRVVHRVPQSLSVYPKTGSN